METHTQSYQIIEILVFDERALTGCAQHTVSYKWFIAAGFFIHSFIHFFWKWMIERDAHDLENTNEQTEEEDDERKKLMPENNSANC